MDILKTVLTIIFVIDCIALAAIILLQEGKSAGLGTISGAADSYWGTQQGPFHGGNACEGDTGCGCTLHRTGCSPEPWCLKLVSNALFQKIIHDKHSMRI